MSISSGSKERLQQRPLYAVVFATRGDPDAAYPPVVQLGQEWESEGTVPHGLDRELVQALPGLWYCLHLPNTFAQLRDIPLGVIKACQSLDLAHRIVLAPISAFDLEHLGHWPPALTAPALVVCPDELRDQAQERASALGFPFPPVSYSELSDEALASHWRAIHTHFLPDEEYLGRELTLAKRLDIQPADLPARWLARQMGVSGGEQYVDSGSFASLIDDVLYQQGVLAAIARLEHESATLQEAEARMPDVLPEELAKLRMPVTLAVPGVAAVFARRAFSPSVRGRIQVLTAMEPTETWSPTIDNRSDALLERSAIEFIATHRSLAQSSHGLMLPSAPAEAFTLWRSWSGTSKQGQ